jgi:L-ascorbate metabolism protein UlaG (beta-lactamase superfamily)
MIRIVGSFACGVVSSTCAAPRLEAARASIPVCATGVCADTPAVKVTYLGVAGFVIEARGSVLLTGPFFSHYPVADIAPSKVQFLFDRWKAPEIFSQTDIINRWLPKDEARKATMIVVGHGHYDHLMDVPYIAKKYARTATIYGGPSIARMFYSDSDLRRRTVAIDSAAAGSGDRPGTSYESSDRVFRIRAIRADHAPTVRVGRLGSIRYAHRRVAENMERLPRTAEEWKEGEPLTYVIDVLSESGTMIFRIYYQDTANSAPLGVPPDSMAPFDLAILAVANARQVRPRAPDALLRALQPRFVIAAHWEDFFTPYSTDVVACAGTRHGDFEESVRANAPVAELTVPTPQQSLPFAIRQRRHDE